MIKCIPNDVEVHAKVHVQVHTLNVVTKNLLFDFSRGASYLSSS